MFKVLKYLMFANLYNRAKKSFFILFGSIISIILISLIINDAVSVANGISVYILLIIKWVSILSLMALIGFTILKIINIATTPFTSEKVVSSTDETVVDRKKDLILNKEKLFTKRDLILQKYIKDQ